MQETIYQDFGKVIIRSPLYSYQRLFRPEGKTVDLDDLVSELLEDPVFIEGIYWSSPQLHQTVLDFKNGISSPLKKTRLFMTLKKYALRASTRCTPYGIYAGCNVADIGINDKSSIEAIKVRIVRIDVGLLQQIVRHLEADNEIWPYLHYHINNSWYPLPNQYRFLESTIEGKKRQYQVSSIERTEVLEEIIELSKTGLLNIDNIFALMPGEVTYEESKAFVKGLIDTQFLTSELRLGLTIADELERLQQIIERVMQWGVAEARRYVELFALISAIIKEFKQLPLGVLPIEEINSLKNILGEMGIEPIQGHLFHADLMQPFLSDDLPKTDLKELEKAIRILSKLSTTHSSQDTQIVRFKSLFKEKYAGREIPLAEALDAEFGIGFPPGDGIGNSIHNSLIEQLDVLSKTSGKAAAGKCHPWLQHKTAQLSTEIFENGLFINDKDLEEFADKSTQLANHFAVMGTAIPLGYTLLQSVGGSHANVLLGRFGYMGDEMRNLCEEIADLEAERNKEVIFAEIIHIPEGRVGNIARRPLLSKYEIPYLASSTLDVQNQLPLEDLLVSVQQDEIILRSKKWDKRVIPRLSNAHNYSNSTVSVYKFLAAIQHQGVPGFEINWGTDIHTKYFLPRLSYKKFILHPACWFFRETHINQIIQAENPLIMLRSFFKNWHIPRYVFFTEGDNELFIDTLNDSYLSLLLNEIKACKLVKLVEWLHGGAIENETKGATTIQQFILPLHKKNPGRIRPAKKLIDKHNVKRTFEPGSEWLYFKIYCGAYVADDILLKVFSPVISFLLKEGIISKAFFIRYTDPHHHLRLRLLLLDGANELQYANAVKHVYKLLHPYVADETVWRVQMDTYEREIERYGEDEILNSEELFFHDSSLFLTCLEDETFMEDQQIRFLTALKNIDAWLSVFDLTLAEKADFCEKMSDAFAEEFHTKVKLQLDVQYRSWKPLISPFLTDHQFDIPFEKRSVALKKITLKIENLSSYIHMSINRWFSSEQRLMEYMAYHFCRKYYNQLAYHTNAGK